MTESQIRLALFLQFKEDGASNSEAIAMTEAAFAWVTSGALPNEAAMKLLDGKKVDSDFARAASTPQTNGFPFPTNTEPQFF